MMVQIVKIDEEIIHNIPNVLELLYEIYGPKTIGLFAVVVDNELGFVARSGENCVYIHKNGYNNFTLNESEELGAVRVDDFEVFFGDELYFVDSNNIEQHLVLSALDEKDVDDYDGCVSYKQYNPNNDTLCEMRFQHMYREIDDRPIIYGYHTKKIDCLYIDEEYTKKGYPKKGILPRRSKYYTKVEFGDDMVGYKMTLIRDYGLIEFLKKGSYGLDVGRNIVRYAKTQFIDLEGNFRDFWPFGEQLNTDSILQMIKDYGFRTELPWQLIEIYNGRNELINTILEIVKQMKVISKEVKEKNESDNVAILSLKND